MSPRRAIEQLDKEDQRLLKELLEVEKDIKLAQSWATRAKQAGKRGNSENMWELAYSVVGILEDTYRALSRVTG